jgi:hypothetical protein
MVRGASPLLTDLTEQSDIGVARTPTRVTPETNPSVRCVRTGGVGGETQMEKIR